MRKPLRECFRVLLFGWPQRDVMPGYTLLPVSMDWGRFGWRNVLRPFWAVRRFLYCCGANV